jgi:hypothetical protein
MKRPHSGALCAITLAALAAITPAQGKPKSHDALAGPRAKAAFENQRVLLYLSGGEPAANQAVTTALSRSAKLTRLLRYDYQLAAIPAASVAGIALSKQFGLDKIAAPSLVILTAKDQKLAQLTSSQVYHDGTCDVKAVQSLLDTHKCSPKNARTVLSEGIARAKKTKRDVFVYLSAPW